ncbi:MAG: Maltodextrin phosphorylase [Lentisphaerae bacterium ADurb.BinA184]|nr:MAG: Maltodextrin phosphorylase [Lentisphaerae bacterium ADurb.BinA184]
MSRLTNTALFEVSWEVCNKVGGIYTVIRSKIPQALAEFGDNYCLLGPYLARNPEFQETDEPCWREPRQWLEEHDFECRFGRWAVDGWPKVILLRPGSRYNTDQLLYRLWESFGVDSIAGGWDYVEPVLFSTVCAEAIVLLEQKILARSQTKVIAHFHEWMTGAGLLHVKENAPNIATVFTTHATVLGRSYMGSGRDLYRDLEAISPQNEARQLNIVAKHSMESVTAREADAFAAVSKITGWEAQKILGRQPSVITENAMEVEAVPDLAANRQPALASRGRLLDFAGRFLGQRPPEHTRILLISGRYEYVNKGVDVFLDALAELRAGLHPGQDVLALFCILGGHLERRPDGARADGTAPICTHRLRDENHDPIVSRCLALGVTNRAEDLLKVIFVPVYLCEGDGVLNLPYYEVLQGVDLGVFPSQYEPWGYTPLESVVYAVPTITTDQAGFGLWVQESDDLAHDRGVLVLPRRGRSRDEVVKALAQQLRTFIAWSDEELAAQRAAARAIGGRARWTEFYQKYLNGYELALRSAEKRAFRREAIESGLVGSVVAARESQHPHFRTFVAEKTLPAKIIRLRELAGNLWWSWHPAAENLFERIDPERWEQLGWNPIRLLDEVPVARLTEIAESVSYVRAYDEVMAVFDAYMGDTTVCPDLPATAAISWQRPIAYFSTEFGLHESLPLYSGGLGVLSGDHLKSASDLSLPLVGVGLFYSHGYFNQRIDRDGNQVPEYNSNDFINLPLKRMQADDSTPLTVSVDLPGRTLYAFIWKLQVGRITLYLLDTDASANTPQDRHITDQLYVGDERVRLEQEILLGVGGARALRKLGIAPSVYHINEGHSAFLIIENIREAMANGDMSFEEATELVKGHAVFTTHTPVEAGNERFARDLILYYFNSFVKELGITPERFFELGRQPGGDADKFLMTVLALKMTSIANGVSALHGRVARQMWEPVWGGVHRSMVPICAVTNGIHVPSYIGHEMRELLDTYLGLQWDRGLPSAKTWAKMDNVPGHLLWDAKQEMKQRLIAYVRECVARDWNGEAQPEISRDEVLGRIRTLTLTLGFARRFAPYKRATLLFSDLDRLDRIVNNPRRPVQIVFAGKAHPRDQQGCELVRDVVRLTRDPRFAGRIVFLEDYDLRIGKMLVQGVDVWLNTPRRPFEASGTSGQKAAANATINLSVADGWWHEAASESNGWTIGPMPDEVDETSVSDDARESSDLYSLLEDVIVPMYYQRNARGLPERWLDFMRESVGSVTPFFNSHRMVTDYFAQLYKPAAERAAELEADDGRLARELAEWRRHVQSRFSSVHLVDLTRSGLKSGSMQAGETFGVKARVNPGELAPGELCIDLIIGHTDAQRQIRDPIQIRMAHINAETKERIAVFAAEYTVEAKGSYSYGIRIIPYHEKLPNKFDAGLALWA